MDNAILIITPFPIITPLHVTISIGSQVSRQKCVHCCYELIFITTTGTLCFLVFVLFSLFPFHPYSYIQFIAYTFLMNTQLFLFWTWNVTFKSLVANIFQSLVGPLFFCCWDSQYLSARHISGRDYVFCHGSHSPIYLYAISKCLYTIYMVHQYSTDWGRESFTEIDFDFEIKMNQESSQLGICSVYPSNCNTQNELKVLQLFG